MYNIDHNKFIRGGFSIKGSIICVCVKMESIVVNEYLLYIGEEQFLFKSL